MATETQKLKLLVVISIFWIIIIILIVTSQSEEYWRFSDYALPIFLLATPVWLFWSLYWIWPDKVKKLFHKKKKLEYDSNTKSELKIKQLESESENLSLDVKVKGDENNNKKLLQREITKKSFKRLTIYFFINFISAIYIASLKIFVVEKDISDPESMLSPSHSNDTGSFYGYTSGIFIVLIAPMLIVTIILRSLKKNIASDGLLLFYYSILFLWLFIYTFGTIGFVKHFNIDLVASLTKGYAIECVFYSTLHTVIIFGVVYVIGRWYLMSPSKIK